MGESFPLTNICQDRFLTTNQIWKLSTNKTPFMVYVSSHLKAMITINDHDTVVDWF